MRKKEVINKREAMFLVINLFLSIIAFSFIISINTEIINAQNGDPLPKTPENVEKFTGKLSADPKAPPSPQAGSSTLTPTSAGSGKISTPFGQLDWNPIGKGFNSILSGLIWAGVVFGAVYGITSMFGMEKDQSLAISAGLASSVFVWKSVYELSGISQSWYSAIGGDFLGLGIGILPLLGGFLVGALVAALLWSDEYKKILTFLCHPWEPPVGGSNCEKCNSDIYPCSEYRCKSLGQACQIIDAGTEKEKCVWINPKDVNSPIIEPLADSLPRGYKYVPDNTIRPPDHGVKIVNTNADSEDECVKAFEPLEFGIKTNEPSQCMIDYNRTEKYEQMSYFFGGSKLHSYNHTQKMRLPGPANVNAEAPELQNEGDYNLYVKCRDANGNANDDLFVIKFCVEKGPDVSPPKIEATSINNNMPVQAGLKEAIIDVYVNEPSECKWSRTDQDYDNMDNEMECADSIIEMNNMMLYTCKANLTGLVDKTENKYYFRCKDQAFAEEKDRNENKESYAFTLKGSRELLITDVKPANNEIIYGTGNAINITLEVETQYGCCEGKAWCYYYTSDEEKKILFFETDKAIHKQRLDLPEGEYTYNIQCVDLGGNANTTSRKFTISIDGKAPVVTRAFKEGNELLIKTNEKANCYYNFGTCNFDIDKNEGIKMTTLDYLSHSADWNVKDNYYIRCKDVYGNTPGEGKCSIALRGWEMVKGADLGEGGEEEI